MRIKITLIIFCSLFMQGCSSDTMAKYNIVQGLRTLALIADHPEINFDGTSFTPSTVSITPVISDIYGSNRALSYNLYWCIDPGIGLGVTPSCTLSPSLVADPSLQNVTISAPSGTFTSPNFTGALSPITLNFTSAFMGSSVFQYYTAKLTSLTPAQLFNGYSILVFFELYPTADPTQKITAFKRIVFSGNTKTPKNQNPNGLEIRLDGTEISGLPTTEKRLEAYVPSTEAESYLFMNADGSLSSITEKIETTWFLTGPSDIKCSNTKSCTPDGVLTLSRTIPGELNLFSPPQVSTPTSRGRVLMGIARDERGGAMLRRYVDGTGP
jgi:hypothetical protein